MIRTYQLIYFWCCASENEFSLESFLPEDWESVNTQKMIRNNFEGGAYTELYMLIEGDVATPETLSGIYKIETDIKDEWAHYSNHHNVLFYICGARVSNSFSYMGET